MAKITIFSRTVCPYCDMAKTLLTAKGAEYTVKNVEDNMEEFSELAQKHSHQTVPMIFINDEFIGGFDDLKALQDSGDLDKKLV